MLVRLFALLLLGSSLAAHADDAITRVFSNMSSEYPTFVAADAVLTEEGEVDPSLFNPEDARIIAHRLSKKPADCLHTLASPSRGYIDTSAPPVPSGLAAFARRAERIFVGEVVAATPGFRRTTPGTLLELAVARILKGKDEGYSSYYVVAEEGTFQVGDKKFCATAPQHASLPAIGDEVLVIVQHHDWNGQFLFIENHHGFFSFDQGEVSLPKDVVTSNPELRHLSRVAFIDKISSFVHGSESPGQDQ